MRIIGFNLSKISAQRKEKTEGKLEINQNVDIKNVKPEKIPISEEEAIRIDFAFVITYSKDFARLEFEGNLGILPNKEELKEFKEAWKNKQIPEKSRVSIFNFIMNKCNIKALDLEDQLTLPTHIPLPRLQPGQQPDAA